MKSQSPSEKKLLQICFADFDSNLPKKVSEILNDEKIINVLSYYDWKIDHGKFNRQEWYSIFPFMISASCSELWLNFNMQKKIIMSISKTNFVELKLLDLKQNKIKSIEQLQFINMPFLEELYLGYNDITKTSALNKCKWGNFNKLVLSYNPIEQLEISRLQINNQECTKKKYTGDQKRGHNWILVSAKIDISQMILYESTNVINARSRILESFKAKKMEFTYW